MDFFIGEMKVPLFTNTLFQFKNESLRMGGGDPQPVTEEGAARTDSSLGLLTALRARKIVPTGSLRPASHRQDLMKLRPLEVVPAPANDARLDGWEGRDLLGRGVPAAGTTERPGRR